MSSTPVNLPQDENKPSWIPEGYVEIIGPDDRHYVVPQHFASALHQNIDGHQEKGKLGIEKAAGTVSELIYVSSFFGGTFINFISLRSVKILVHHLVSLEKVR